MEFGLIAWGLLFIFGLVYFLSPLIIVGRLGELIALEKKMLEELKRLTPPSQRPMP